MSVDRRKTRAEKIKRFTLATRIDPKSRGPKLTLEQKRHVAAMVERAKYLDFAQSLNGPNFFIDRKLREFVQEYNNRTFSAYGSQQPESFNVIKDFVEPDDDAFVLKILPEKYLSVDLNYILDRLTDPNLERKAKDLFQLEESTIYSVAVPGGYGDLQFTGIKQLALFGWSCVRHGDELSIFGIAAKNNPDKSLEPLGPNSAERNPAKPFLPDGNLDINHEDFFEYSLLYPVVFLMTIDLSRGTTLVRYILTERKDTFDVITDNRETYTFLSKGGFGRNNIDAATRFENSYRALQEHSQVFALLGELPHILLGVYDSDDMSIVRAPTGLRMRERSTQVRKARKTLAKHEVPNFVNVATIVWPNQPSSFRKFSVVEFKVEQKGYWKSLRPDQLGVGKNGDQVQGKTWVNVTESWEESLGFSPPQNSKTVSVRSGIHTSESGEVYVMRNAQHEKDVYKVGFTTKTADERASQLASSTGQPDSFGVMNSWKVKNPRRVEGIIHERLAQYRLTQRREFFKVKYTTIQSVVEQVIAELDAKPD
ncbi:MAG: GIY-YIG nuclease family protein [Rhodobacteraceae bacterium]|nr:GIY-YIG nuclease family protein [Paracoccaceae bacterium]